MARGHPGSSRSSIEAAGQCSDITKFFVSCFLKPYFMRTFVWFALFGAKSIGLYYSTTTSPRSGKGNRLNFCLPQSATSTAHLEDTSIKAGHAASRIQSMARKTEIGRTSAASAQPIAFDNGSYKTPSLKVSPLPSPNPNAFLVDLEYNHSPYAAR